MSSRVTGQILELAGRELGREILGADELFQIIQQFGRRGGYQKLDRPRKRLPLRGTTNWEDQ